MSSAFKPSLKSSPPAPPVQSNAYSLENNFKLPRFEKNTQNRLNIAQQKTLTAKDKVEQMVNHQLQSQKASILQPRHQPENSRTVHRLDNSNFMREFNQIFYKKEDPSALRDKVSPRKNLKEQIQPHGMNLINFTLTEHLLEEKIQNATEDALLKTENKIASEMQKKTKDLRKYMDQQF